MWYEKDIRNVNAGNVPRADIICFGAPCQDFSIAGNRAGLGGDRSSLVGQVFRLIDEIAEELRPKWLVYENVKGMLSSNGGRDYLAILAEMDRLGYDVEWQNINSKWFVPQNRERIYTVGHFRAYGRKEIFPLEGTDGKDSVHGIEQVGQLKSERSNSNAYRVYSAVGIAPTLSTMEGGGREPHIIEEAPIKRIGHAGKFARYMQTYDPQGKCEALDTGGGADTTHTLRCRERERERTDGSGRNRLQQGWSRTDDSERLDDEGLRHSEPQTDRNGGVICIGNTHPSGRGMNGNVFSSEGIAPTVTTNKGEGNKIAIYEDK